MSEGWKRADDVALTFVFPLILLPEDKVWGRALHILLLPVFFVYFVLFGGWVYIGYGILRLIGTGDFP